MKIIASARHLPTRRVDHEQMDQLINAKAGWSKKRTGVCERYFIAKGENAPKMGAIVGTKALQKAGLNLTDIDLILGACGTYAQILPCNAALIKEELEKTFNLKTTIPAFDVNATCISFPVALKVAQEFLKSNTYKRILVISSEAGSVGLNYKQKESAALIGDGAAAFIVENSGADVDYLLRTYSVGAHMAEIRGGGTTLPPFSNFDSSNPADFQFDMNGLEIFKLTLQHMPGFIAEILETSNTMMEEIKLVIPHQASFTALKQFRGMLKIPKEKFYIYIQDHGNQIAASIPTGLSKAIDEGLVKEGDKVLLCGTAAGLTIGGMVLTI